MFLLSEIFYWIFNMSIAASITGAVVLLLGKIRKIPRKAMHLLFAIPFLRMFLPAGLSSKYSLMSLLSKIAARTVTVYEGPPLVTTTNFTMAANAYFPIAYKTFILMRVFRCAAVIWLCVAATLLLMMLAVYIAATRELKGARHLQDNVYLCGRITSPAVYGILHEKIVLPKVYAPEELRFILLHENAHIRRKDNFFRLLAVVTVCIHWFNPFAWLFLKRFFANMELAADETVLRQCEESDKKQYAETLLHSAERKSLYASPFGGAKLRHRIDYIFSYQKLSTLSAVAFSLLLLAVSYVLLTNAV